jgi:hypothetical protein
MTTFATVINPGPYPVMMSGKGRWESGRRKRGVKHLLFWSIIDLSLLHLFTKVCFCFCLEEIDVMFHNMFRKKIPLIDVSSFIPIS